MPHPDERYQVRNDEIERTLRTLGTIIDAEIPEGWAFGLFLVPFGNNAPEPQGRGAVFWISNGDREGMMDIVQGWLDHQKTRKKQRLE